MRLRSFGVHDRASPATVLWSCFVVLSVLLAVVLIFGNFGTENLIALKDLLHLPSPDPFNKIHQIFVFRTQLEKIDPEQNRFL
jgi:hypothetical protein